MNRPSLNRLGIAACLVAAAIAVPGGGTASAAPSGGESLIKGAGPAAIPGSYIVIYKDSTDADPAALADLTSGLAATHSATVTHTYTTALRGFAATMDQAQAELLAANPAVAEVSLDQRGSLLGTQSSPPSWGLDRADQRDRPLDNRYVYSTTASNVHAYIVDTGIRTSHQDFGGRAVWDVNLKDTNNTDCNGHGTHVAGTVGGTQYGIAKGVRLHAVKVADCSGQVLLSTFLAAVNWLTAHAIKPAVVNVSLGFSSFQITQAQANAVRTSMNSGLVYVAAAGNGNTIGCNVFPPSVGGTMIGVGATTSTDAKASFSNFGGCLDLWAPGQGIRSATHTSDTASGLADGTSMSAPHVAGAAALYLAGHPTASAAQVHDTVVFNSTIDRLTIPPCGCGSGSATVSANRLLYTPINPPGAGTNTLTKGQSLQPGTSIRANRGNHILIMQTDGNLVHYQGSKPLWNSGTHGNPGASAVMQTDGNFVIYSSSGVALWATNTGGTAANKLIMQDDANIVLQGSVAGRPPMVFWSSR